MWTNLISKYIQTCSATHRCKSRTNKENTDFQPTDLQYLEARQFQLECKGRDDFQGGRLVDVTATQNEGFIDNTKHLR
jgi:hypothetical protein